MVGPNAYAFVFHMDFDADVPREGMEFYPDGSEAGLTSIAANIFRAILILDIVLICEPEMRADVEKLQDMKG